jgi:hypothetical protein
MDYGEEISLHLYTGKFSQLRALIIPILTLSQKHRFQYL